MKINTQQKVLGAVLVIGLVALGLDRSGLARAHTQPASVQTEAEEIAPPVVSDTPKPASAPSLSARLRGLEMEAKKSENRDAFSDDRAVQSQRIAIDANAFARDHRLTAVFVSRAASHVIIDGRLMKVGDVLQGLRLAAIANGTATFAAGEDAIVLKLASSSPAAAR
jgi:hypothetical protein